ncbi:MAG: Gfo/Idh/MocA family oxidoreductase [Tepidisphaeraceae bacterium]
MQTIGFLGVAHIHVPGFWRMLSGRTDVKVATVWDEEPARRSHWATATGAREAASVDDAIAGVDAVVITSQTDAHATLVQKVAAAKKPMFVEKPLGLGAADAYAMAKQIEAAARCFRPAISNAQTR